MLPKPARLLLLAAVLASTHARGAPKVETVEAPRPDRCNGGRVTNEQNAVAFAGCRVVTGDLAIEGTELSDLSAFSELRSVRGALTIRSNAKLRTLYGLEHLEHAGTLVLRANGLYGTRGLEGLRQLDTLVIANNRLLISLRGFRNLERVGTLVVEGNARICAQVGLFPALQSVDERLTVTSNYGLSRDEVADLFARSRAGLP
jgi:hypothetical protein